MIWLKNANLSLNNIHALNHVRNFNQYCASPKQRIELIIPKKLVLSQLDQLNPMFKGPHAVVICSQLYKYTQQHTASFTENSTGPRIS
jgi:hypothetical protein